MAITQGTLQLAATKMREESLANSRLFGGISDGTTTLTNTSYDSGYFDGVKLGGVRIDLDAIDPKLNPAAKDMYGVTGGFQPIQGQMLGQYQPGSWKDLLVEAFAGTHDIQGG